MNQPRRGEIWLVDLGMAAKVRPCLVISVPASDTERAFATLVPHTTSLTVPLAKLLRRLGVLNNNLRRSKRLQEAGLACSVSGGATQLRPEPG